MKKSKFIIEAYENRNTHSVNIKIIDYIGGYDNRASDIRSIVEQALQNGIKKAEVFISSGGGSTIEAQAMVLELRKFDSVHITVGALAASAATYLLTQFPSSAYPESQLMIHRPTIDTYGTVEEIKADLKLLENTEKIYREAYAKTFNKTEAEIDELWQNDYWMTAKEAYELGLIKNIISADIEWSKEVFDQLTACGAPKIPKTKLNSKNKMDKNKIISALGLAADTTDEQLYTAITEMKSKADVSAKLSEQLSEVQKQKVETLVANAIRDKKITADQKETYESLAKADYDATEKAIESLPSITALSGQVNPNSTTTTSENRDNWTYQDYAEKDPKAFEKLMETDPAKAMAIYERK